MLAEAVLLELPRVLVPLECTALLMVSMFHTPDAPVEMDAVLTNSELDDGSTVRDLFDPSRLLEQLRCRQFEGVDG